MKRIFTLLLALFSVAMTINAQTGLEEAIKQALENATIDESKVPTLTVSQASSGSADFTLSTTLEIAYGTAVMNYLACRFYAVDVAKDPDAAFDDATQLVDYKIVTQSSEENSVSITLTPTEYDKLSAGTYRFYVQWGWATSFTYPSSVTGSLSAVTQSSSDYTVTIATAVSETLAAEVYTAGGTVYAGTDNFKIYNLLGQDVSGQNGNLKGIYVVAVGNSMVKVKVD